MRCCCRAFTVGMRSCWTEHCCGRAVVPFALALFLWDRNYGTYRNYWNYRGPKTAGADHERLVQLSFRPLISWDQNYRTYWKYGEVKGSQWNIRSNAVLADDVCFSQPSFPAIGSARCTRKVLTSNVFANCNSRINSQTTPTVCANCTRCLEKLSLIHI